MDFNQVRYFLALAETSSFTRAAEQCGVSQPALSQAIKRLERELGGPLVTRDGARTVLSELGHAIHEQLRQIDQTRRKIESTAQSVTTGEKATINIGVMCTVGHKLISPMLSAFRATHPGISLALHDIPVGAVTDLLISGAIDGAFLGDETGESTRLRYIPLYRESLVVACAWTHPFAKQEVVSLEVIAKEPYIDHLNCEFRHRFFDYVGHLGLSVDIVASSQREDWLQGLIGESVGVSIVPEFTSVATSVTTRPLTVSIGRNVRFAMLNNAIPAAPLGRLLEAVSDYVWTKPTAR